MELVTHAPAGARPPAVLTTAVALADGVNRWVGRVVAWMTLGTVVVCFATVYLRYALGTNFIWLQEIYVWQHVMVIVLGAGYTMMTGGFVRVDVLYSRWGPRRRAAVDLALSVLLLGPFLWVFWTTSLVFFRHSLASDEGSMNPGGLPDLWLLKGTLLAFCALVALQGVAFVARGLLVLGGHERFVLDHAGHAPDRNV